MKASELMIGDWVNLSKGNWSESRQVGLVDIEMIAESVYLADPIPLTPEILEKNGFIYNDNPVKPAYKGHGLYIFYHWEGGYSVTVGVYQSIKFRFVHELQRLCGLCKIEKGITI